MPFEEKFDGEDWKLLEDALRSAFPKLSDLTQMVKHHLDQHFSDISLPENLKDAVFNLVEWASSHGELKQLVDGAWQENPGNPELQIFRLYYLLKSAGFLLTDLLPLYHQSLQAPHKRYYRADGPFDIFSLVQNLGQLPIAQPENNLPLLRFAGLLAKHSKAQDFIPQAQLVEWMNTVAKHHKLPENAVADYLQTGQFGSVQHTALWVIVEPSNLEHTQFNITIYSVATDHQYTLCYKAEDQDLSYLPSALLEVLNELADQNDDRGSLQVEFFLPFDLLIRPIDQSRLPLPFSKPDLHPKLCAKYGVIMRPLARVQNPILYIDSQRQWALLEACQDVQQQIEHFKAISHRELPALTTERRKWLKNWICIGLHEIPDQDRTTVDLLEDMIAAGLPIIIWLRQAGKINDLEDLANQHGLIGLPESVQAIRQAACETDGQHSGNYLSLIWDDPNHRPPRYLLRFA